MPGQPASLTSTPVRPKPTARRLFDAAKRWRQPVELAGLWLACRPVVQATPVDCTDIVLLVPARSAALADRIARARPHARVHVLARGPHLGPDRLVLTSHRIDYRRVASPAARADFAACCPAPQLIIDADGRPFAERWQTFADLFLALAPGGRYALIDPPDDADGAGGEFARALLAGRVPEPGAEQPPDSPPEEQDAGHLAEACAAVDRRPRRLVVTKAGHRHRFKLRESAANQVLTARFGPRCEIVQTHRPRGFVSRATITGYGDGPTPRAGRPIPIPSQHLRRYGDAVCWSMQRVALDNVLLPDTFRHPLQRRLTHLGLADSSSRHGRLPADEPEAAAARRLPGSWFHFDTEYPGHFGHVTTEVVSRYWGWVEAQQLDPDVRPLLSADDSGGVPAFQRDLFRALDIDVDRAELIQRGACVRVERLYAATPRFAMPHYADDQLADTWARISEQARTPLPDAPRRLFVSRRASGVRYCTNSEQVEEFFTDLGFTVVYPEDHPFGEQVAMFDAAEVLAGFGGSGMFGMMWGAAKPTILLSGHSYTANNEYLLGSVLGSPLHYFWGRSEVEHPAGHWSWAAFESKHRVDLDEHGPALRALLDG